MKNTCIFFRTKLKKKKLLNKYPLFSGKGFFLFYWNKKKKKINFTVFLSKSLLFFFCYNFLIFYKFLKYDNNQVFNQKK